MKRLSLAVALVGVLGFLMVGCEKGPAESAAEGVGKPPVAPGPNMAAEIRDGSTPYNAFQSLCPVTGKRLDPNYYYDHAEGRIYFASKAALDTFTANPDEYLAKMTPQKLPEMQR